MKAVEGKKGGTKYKLVLTQSEKKISLDNKLHVEAEFKQRQSETLRLNKGSSFWSLQDDFWPIYDNFNLASYFSPTCQARICSRIYGEQHHNFIKADIVTFKFTVKTYLIIQISRDPKQFKTDKKQLIPVLPSERNPLKILYQICQLPQGITKDENQVEIQMAKKYINSQTKVNLVVEFVTKIEQEYDESSLLCHINKKNPKVQVFDKHREMIHINIVDQEEVLKDLSVQNNKEYGHRISEVRKSKIKQIEYFYKEPENERFKYINGKHLSLALQGGGCKGVQYVGAYQAILQAKTKITSIIGSSAGSILGLAIGLNLKPQQIIKLCETKLSKVADDQKFRSLDEEQKNFMRKTCTQVVDFLYKFNIFDSHLTSSFIKCFEDAQFRQILLKLIKVATNSQIHKLFLDHKSKDLNLLGLLNGSLMTGNIIKQIAVNCIYLYFLNDQEQKSKIKLFKRFPDLEKRAGKQSDLYAIAENMNMKELYQLTGVEFTCTAVDIDNQILRFLNQKTTPDLPVCRAVQMSGSFPVAFEAQKWQKAWGKYYIHYDNIRREIDLTGCRLTDGGTLANFPVKYLDNEDMRPMYFSHAKDANTDMYGIGLITDIPKQKKKEEELEQVLNELKQRAMKIIGVLGPFCSWIFSKITFCKCEQPKQQIVKIGKNPFEAFTKIPIVQFLLKLLQTYTSTKDNLTEQCFSHSTYETPVRHCYQNQIRQRPSEDQVSANIQRLSSLLQKTLKDQGDNKDAKFQKVYETFTSNLRSLANCPSANFLNQKRLCEAGKVIYYNISSFLVNLINHYQLKNEKLDQIKKQTRKRIVQTLREHLKSYFLNHHPYPKIMKRNLLRAFLSKIKQVGEKKFFVMCQVKEDFEELSVIVQTTITFCERLKATGELAILSECLTKIREKQNKEINAIIEKLKAYSKQRLNKTGVDKKIAHSLFKLNELTITMPCSKIKLAKSLIQQSEVPDFFIYQEADRHRDLIKAYTLDRIHDYYSKNAGYQDQIKPPNGLHLVLESVSLSELYFHEYFMIVKDLLLQYNTQYKKMIESHVPMKSKKSICQKRSQQPEQECDEEQQSEYQYQQQENQTDMIEDVQKKMKGYLQVTTMTATGYHSLAIFLHASDLSEQRIGQEVWKIRQLIKLEKEDQQSLKSKYENADWSKVTPILLREIQKKALEKKKDIFEYIQDELLANETECKKEVNKIKRSLEEQIRKIKIENEQMSTVVETSLSYILKILLEIEAAGMEPDKVYETFQEKLFLKQSILVDAENMRREESDRIRGVFHFFYDKYSDIIKYIALSTPFVIDQVMKIMRPEERKQAWKGLILSQFLSTNKIKQYVQQILVELKLSPHTTLKQFYNASSKKIQLNFSVIEENIVAVYNHKTRPSMPVWAAIVAATSIPQFFPPLLDLPEWNQKELQNYKERKVKSYFSKPKNPYVFITSSEALTRLPMDLLQNNKFRDNITDNKDEVFLMFNFSQLKFDSVFQKPIEQFKVKSLTLGECISKFVSFRQGFYGKVGKTLKRQEYDSQMKNAHALKMLSHLPIVQAKSKLLNLYVQSHDNLIIKLYERQLVQMPIRFSTLDFHVMTQQRKFLGANSKLFKQQKLSDICQDAIMQAQYIITEKMTNRQNIQEQNRKKKIFLKSNKKITEISEPEIKQSSKKKESQNSQRYLYFRVESKLAQKITELRNQLGQEEGRRQICKKVENKDMIGCQTANSFNVKQSSIVHPETETSGMDLVRYKQQLWGENVLKFRFLSMMNPSQELYERYHLYYRLPTTTTPKMAHRHDFTKIKTECLQVEMNKCKADGSLRVELKVEYPSEDLLEVKTKYFILDLGQLFDLNRILIRANKCNRFGFIYRLEFDKIYGHDENYKFLHPLDCYETDYLNMNTDLQQKVPEIRIKSNLEKMVERASRCQECIAPLKKRRNNEGKGELFCETEVCRVADLVANRFRIRYDNSAYMLKCSQGHEMVKTESTAENHKKLKYEKCDICGDSCIDYMWLDRDCFIVVCDECKSRSLELCNDNY